MARWVVDRTFRVGRSIIVEAETEEKAYEKAMDIDLTFYDEPVYLDEYDEVLVEQFD